MFCSCQGQTLSEAVETLFTMFLKNNNNKINLGEKETKEQRREYVSNTNDKDCHVNSFDRNQNTDGSYSNLHTKQLFMG